MTRAAERLRPFGTTVFAEMTALANQHQAINLGQGFPDFPAPDFIKRAAQEAIAADRNQYAPGRGLPDLREAVAAKIERQVGLSYDPAAEIVVTVGATEALFASIMGLVDPGDEVILFEPYYDAYCPVVAFAGGLPRFYTLRPPDWRIDPGELRALFSERTKLVIINSPHNPTGKVFSADELQIIGDLCREHDVIAVTDEVYEHIVFDGLEHQPLSAIKGMRERTLMISSLGKTFSVTGWKVGWAAGPADLCTALVHAKQYATFCAAAPLQAGAAEALKAPDAVYADLAAMYQSNRDFLVGALREAGLEPITPGGTYFVMADISHLPFEGSEAFCRWLAAEVGVAAIPPGSFYHNAADGDGLARFAFCKTPATLEEAAERLIHLQEKL